MTITESKLKTGTLTLGGTTFACQATNVTITPSYSSTGDALETLCGDELAPATERSDVLKITAIQDFTSPTGFIHYTWAHDLETVAVSWTPTTPGPTYTGSVQIKAVEVGGDVNKRLTTDAEWDFIGAVVVTYP